MRNFAIFAPAFLHSSAQLLTQLPLRKTNKNRSWAKGSYYSYNQSVSFILFCRIWKIQTKGMQGKD